MKIKKTILFNICMGLICCKANLRFCIIRAGLMIFTAQRNY